ncbi:MAG: hypothetical protein NTX50_04815 [Candidatus Sumerlaeota bacterium]|nr:hypothetical protein [Candidatus Sumerlaeota bacterium]
MRSTRRKFLLTAAGGNIGMLVALIALFVFLSGVTCGGIEEFRWVKLDIHVVDANGQPVEECQIKAYSQDWPLARPDSGFVKTNARGIARMEIPRGRWLIVAGGGKAYNVPASGQGLLLAQVIEVAADAQFRLAADRLSAVSLMDRMGQWTDVDELYAAPSSLVPTALLPAIGTTLGGVCRIATNTDDPTLLFFVRKPTEKREGYFLSFDKRRLTGNLTCRAASESLRGVEFVSPGPNDKPGPVRWELAFTSLDLERSSGFVAFCVPGRCYAWTNLPFFRYLYWANWPDHPQNWQYESYPQGLDLRKPGQASLKAGGKLSSQLRIVPKTVLGNTQFCFDPVLDSFGNRIWWYFPQPGPLKIDISLRARQDGGPLISTSFDRSQNVSIQFDKQVPPNAFFRVHWPLGPWGGNQVIEGKLDEAKYQFKSETLTTPHFVIHYPQECQPKADDLARRLEDAYGVYAGWIGRDLPQTESRNIYIQPAGVWASAKGQEIYAHGFYFWHASDPAIGQWLHVIFHEVAHRFQGGHFRLLSGEPAYTSSNAAEAGANQLATQAIDKLFGQEAGAFARRFYADSFFAHVRDESASTDNARNWAFVLTWYLPKRYGPDIITGHWRRWVESWTLLGARGYSKDEAFAALHSRMAGENLWWLFHFCGLDSTEAKIAEATAALPEEWRIRGVAGRNP